MKKIIKLCLMFSVFIIVAFAGFSTSASAAEYYPNSSITVQPGDILYSSKSKSTFFAGHIGIVGSDLKVKHTLPADADISQTVSSFFNQFEDVALIRPTNASLSQKRAAGQWATDNVDKMNLYAFDGNLDTISVNYCSKFVWQAYKKGAGVDISDDKLMRITGMTVNFWITPDQIYNDANNYVMKTWN